MSTRLKPCLPALVIKKVPTMAPGVQTRLTFSQGSSADVTLIHLALSVHNYGCDQEWRWHLHWHPLPALVIKNAYLCL